MLLIASLALVACSQEDDFADSSAEENSKRPSSKEPSDHDSEAPGSPQPSNDAGAESGSESQNSESPSAGGKEPDDSEGGGDEPGDSEGSGGSESPEPSEEQEPKNKGAFVTANIDDDNKNGTADFQEDPFAQDNDIARWELPTPPKGEMVKIQLSGDLAKLKIWKEGKDWMGAGGGKVQKEFSFKSPGDSITLEVEMGDYNANVTMEVISPSRGTKRYPLIASPLILNHHLQRFERVWIVNSPASAPTVEGFRSALSSDLGVLSASSYGNDIWLQDEIEFGTMTGMNGARIDVILDSIRNRGLDAFPEREFTTKKGRSKDWVLEVHGQGRATSGDSFGNLEVSPPVKVGGKKYPFGRIYYGDRANGKLNSQLEQFLQAQQIQEPFGFDTSWLCVSHVDEILTFVPAPSAPKGFLMLFGDTRVGYKMLESMDANAALSHYRYRTVGEMRSDQSLRDRNEEIQQDDLDPTLARFKKELGLDDDDIVLVPALYHDVTGCKGPETAAALIPGTVNMVVLPGKKGEKTKLVIPDPFFRRSGASQSEDLFISYFKNLLPDHFDMHFVDDWEAYHKKHGEVHCASNTKRVPGGQWWKFVE